MNVEGREEDKHGEKEGQSGLGKKSCSKKKMERRN
jgi:hypothetical protein